MAISAIALLRLQTLSGLELKSLRVDRLEDAVLVYTNVDFSYEPETLAQIVLKQAGDVLRTEHRDSRGIFFIPDVAPPKARTYDAVIDEIGEGGVWGPLPRAGVPLGAAAAAGGLGALLGGVLEQMPASVWESIGDAARGQPGALEAASSQLKAAMAGSSQLSDLANQLAGGLGSLANDPSIEAQLKAAGAGGGMPDLASLGQMLGGSGVDLEKLMGQMQSALASDPSRAAELAERFFGRAPSDEEDDEDDRR